MLQVSSRCWTNGETTKDNEQCEKEEYSIHYFCLAPLSDSSLQLWNDCSSEVFTVHCWTKAPLIPHCYSCPPRGFFSFSLSFCPLAVCFAVVYFIIIDDFVKDWKMHHAHTTHLWLAGLTLRCCSFLSDKAKHTLLLLWEYYRKNLIITIIAT